MKNYWTEDDIELLKNLYENGSKEELMKSIPNRTWDAIQLKARSIRLKKNNYKTTARLDKLLEETNLAYYWIGFLLADGHFHGNRLVLTLSEKDAEHIKKFAKFVKGKYLTNKHGQYYVSLMDSKNIPSLLEKFDISSRKTYEPSSIDWIQDDDLLLSLIIGFIDGDGSIRKQTGRNDAYLTIKCHSSWQDNLQFMSDIIAGHCELKPNQVIINKCGYANVNFTNSVIMKFLKKKTKELDLPILKRKWDRIDENFVSKIEAYKIILEEAKTLLQEGVSISDIAKIVNRSYTSVYLMIKKNDLKGIENE